MSKLSQHWLNTRKQDWQRLEQLLQQARQRLSGLSAVEIRELGFLYRATMNDLSRIRSAQDHQHLEPYLNELLVTSHGFVYTNPGVRWPEVLAFFTHRFPQTFRKHSLLIGIAFLLFIVGVALSMIALSTNPSLETSFMPPDTIADLDAGKMWMDPMEAKASQSTMLMQNNIRVAFNAYVTGIFFGVGTLVTMLMNGMSALGGPLQVCINHGMGKELFKFCIAHGVIELSTIFIAGGAGLLVGKSLVFPGPYTRWQALQANAKESLILITGCVPLLVIAGIIEGMISLNKAVPLNIRLIIAGVSAVGLVLYLGFGGLGQKQPKIS